MEGVAPGAKDILDYVSVLGGVIDGVEVALYLGVRGSFKMESRVTNLDVLPTSRIHSLQQCRVTQADNVGPYPDSRAKLVVQSPLSANLSGFIVVDKPPHVGEFGQKRPWNVIEGRPQICHHMAHDEDAQADAGDQCDCVLVKHGSSLSELGWVERYERPTAEVQTVRSEGRIFLIGPARGGEKQALYGSQPGSTSGYTNHTVPADVVLRAHTFVDFDSIPCPT